MERVLQVRGIHESRGAKVMPELTLFRRKPAGPLFEVAVVATLTLAFALLWYGFFGLLAYETLVWAAHLL